MNTIKNCHSPAGMGYSLHGTRYVTLRDCPTCKFGTIDRYENDAGLAWWKCADCKREFSVERIKRYYGSA